MTKSRNKGGGRWTANAFLNGFKGVEFLEGSADEIGPGKDRYTKQEYLLALLFGDVAQMGPARQWLSPSGVGRRGALTR